MSRPWFDRGRGAVRWTHRRQLTEENEMKVRTTGMVGVALVALAACGSTPMAAVHAPSNAWAHGVAESTTELATVLTEIGAGGNATGMQAACTIGVAKMPGWQSLASTITIAAVRTPYVEALSEFSLAFSECVDGDFDSVSSHLDAGATFTNEAAAALQPYV